MRVGVYKQTMVVLCWLCFKVAAPTLKHIGTIHSCEPNFSITCGVHSCPRRYSNFFSFKKHLYRKHRAELELQEFTPIFSNGDDEVHFLNNETQAAETGADVFDVNPITSTTELKKTAALFLLKTKEVNKVSQKALDSIIEDVSSFINFIIKSLELDIKQCLTNSNDINEVLQKYLKLDPFYGLNTLYFQEKYYRECCGLLVRDAVLKFDSFIFI